MYSQLSHKKNCLANYINGQRASEHLHRYNLWLLTD